MGVHHVSRTAPHLVAGPAADHDMHLLSVLENGFLDLQEELSDDGLTIFGGHGRLVGPALGTVDAVGEDAMLQRRNG